MRRFRLVCLLVFAFSGCNPPSSSLPFYRVHFGGDRGWILGGEVYSTDNGGTHWEKGYFYKIGDTLEYIPYHLSSKVQFIDSRTAFHCWDTRLMKTEDGGKTWKRASDQPIFSVFFRDDRFGLGSNRSGLLRTTDGGANWTVIGSNGIGDFTFASDGTVFWTRGQLVQKSDDQGASWKELRRLPQTIFRTKKYADKMWFVGRQGYCASYSWTEHNWEELPVPTSETLLDITISDEVAIVVGGHGTLFILAPESSDWEEVALETNADLISVDFAPDGSAYVVGGTIPSSPFGRPTRIVLVSSDSQRWSQLSLP